VRATGRRIDQPIDAAADDVYPPQLDVTISPADGQDWVDPGLLGADVDSEPVVPPDYAPPEELLASLHTADGSDAPATWDAMATSDDPAVRALATFWRDL